MKTSGYEKRGVLHFGDNELRSSALDQYTALIKIAFGESNGTICGRLRQPKCPKYGSHVALSQHLLSL